MPTAIFDPLNVFLGPAFQADADLNWGEVNEYPSTDRRVEGKGDISDFIAVKPTVCTLESKVTAMAVFPSPPIPQKLQRTRDAVKALCDKRQIVLVVGEVFSGYLAIIRSEISKSVDDGHSVSVKLTLKQIETTTVATTQVSASRLNPKVGGGKKGGSAKPSDGSGKPRALLAKLFDAAKIKVPQIAF